MIRKPNNGKYKCLKPESVQTKVDYAFSFNPETQPIVQSFGKMTLTAFTEWSEEIYKMFTRLQYCEINTYMELSSAGRLHFHGTIQITDIAKFYFFDIKILRFHGSYEIDTINTDTNKWYDYCTKQKGYMLDFCENYGMEYNYWSYQAKKVQFFEKKNRKTKVKIIDQ